MQAYANLEAATPVKVFVTGFVNNPGLYPGFSSDSVLYYLDSAGGIAKGSGSYIDVQVLRQGQPVITIDLYEFLIRGAMPALQLQNGDAILVGRRNHVVSIDGAVQVATQVEFSSKQIVMGELLDIIQPEPDANFVRITQIQGGEQNVVYLPLQQALETALLPGASVAFVQDNDIKTIAVSVRGEHKGPAEYVLPYGATLDDLLSRIDYREHAEKEAIQLYRTSIALKQKQALNRSLNALEVEALTRQPVTDMDKETKTKSATLIRSFIQQARKAEPRGQVVLADNPGIGAMLLEHEDELIIPTRPSTLSVVGEVVFPTSLVFDPKHSIEDYIELAGGFGNNANEKEVVILHLDGTINRLEERTFGRRYKGEIRPGDEIMVMPEITASNLQISKDVTEILYRIAVGTAAVLSF